MAGDQQMQSLFSLMLSGEMERGPRYTAYAHLRESKLRLKNLNPNQPYAHHAHTDDDPEMMSTTTTPSPTAKINNKLKQVRFSPEVGKSVPDFSATLRKENRKPPEMMMKKSTTTTTTSPMFHRGSKSVSPSQKKMAAVRKSFTAFNDLNSIYVSPIQHQQHNDKRLPRPPKTNTFLPNHRRL